MHRALVCSKKWRGGVQFLFGFLGLNHLQLASCTIVYQCSLSVASYKWIVFIFCFVKRWGESCKSTNCAPICKHSKEPRIFDSQPGGQVPQPYLTYLPARLHWLEELIPWNRFLGSLKVKKFGLWARIFVNFPRNRFPAWRVGTTTLFDVQSRFLGSLKVLSSKIDPAESRFIP